MTSTHRWIPNNKELLILSMILVAAFLLRMDFLHEPLERDEGGYAYIGQEILRGNLPYRDAMDQKPPGIHYIYAAIIAMLGATPESIRIGAAIYSIGTVLSVFLCTRRVFGSNAALWSSFLYGIFSSGPLIRGSSSNSEVFMVLPIILSMYLTLVWSERHKTSILVCSGFLLGCALVIKTVALPHIVAGLIFVLIVAKQTRDWKRTALDSSLFLGATAIPQLASVLYFFLKGALGDYYYWTIEFNKMYGQTSPAEFFGHMHLGLSRVFPELTPLLVLAVPALWFVFSNLRTSSAIFIAGSLVAAFIGLSMPTKFYEHYFIQLIPPLAILAGAGLSYILAQRRPIVIIGLILFLTSTAYWVQADYKYYLVYTPEEISTRKYTNDVFVNSVKIAQYIKDRTVPTDYIYQWGFEPELYFLANRRSPNPYTLHFAVAASKDPWEASLSLGNSIISKRPKYIVVQQGRSQYPGFDILSEVLAMLYIHETDLYGSQLWRLR